MVLVSTDEVLSGNSLLGELASDTHSSTVWKRGGFGAQALEGGEQN